MPAFVYTAAMDNIKREIQEHIQSLLNRGATVQAVAHAVAALVESQLHLAERAAWREYACGALASGHTPADSLVIAHSLLLEEKSLFQK